MTKQHKIINKTRKNSQKDYVKSFLLEQKTNKTARLNKHNYCILYISFTCFSFTLTRSYVSISPHFMGSH
ncbi:hypothetical protein VQ7734_00987 [Vibrio quintilis]|uniref:Uncharacterized protein n=1 Tax=Vibrio quintilis TaxID=1117707 RepID=A0A1M7YRN8_9VIBR|nr:hypothetical protein VQ7734_00987 [Vibrio quintilis]